MIDALNLALPYFGLIFIGFACAGLVGTPLSVFTLTSVMWMVKTHTLPPLLFR